MLFTKTLLLAATTLVASASAYYDYDYSLQARDFDDGDYLDLYAREAEDDLIHDLAARDIDELSDLFRRALEVRGTIKRPNLGGNLRLSPGDIARANQAPVQQIPASRNGPPMPLNHGSSFFPPGATHGGAGGHGGAQGGGSRRSSSDSMRSLFGTP